MAEKAPDLPQGTASLLAQAKQEIVQSGELVKLIMSGVRQVDAWLIENRILPVVEKARARTLHLTLAMDDGKAKSASLIPLPDGSAFARGTSGQWFSLDRREATSAIEHLGFRYAPQDHWEDGFHMLLETPGQPPKAVGPLEAAAIWAEITGSKPTGFEDNTLDGIEALGLRVIDVFFDTQGPLGL